MTFAAKLAAPLAATPGVRPPVIERAADGTRTLCTAPAGYFPAETLCVALSERGRPVLWLRLGPEDQDPAQLALDLVAGARQFNAGAGQATLDLMRRQPGPVAGWLPVFHSLSRDLSQALPASAAVVIEHLHQLAPARPTLHLLGRSLLAELPEPVTFCLTADEALPAGTLPDNLQQIGMSALRLPEADGCRWLEQGPAALSVRQLHRAARLASGNSALLAALADAGAQLGPADLRHAVEQAADADDLLLRIAQAWLSVCETDALDALALAVHLEYSHPTLELAALGGAAAPTGPWFQPLASDWRRVRRRWREPLRMALRARSRPTAEALRRAAETLNRQGAVHQGVSALLEAGDESQAARVIGEAAGDLLDHGAWLSLERWLEQISPNSRQASPTLMYTQAELAAAQGQAEAAYRGFALAAELFAAQGQPASACLSLLAESALAAWHGHYTHAQTQAVSAGVMAEAHGLHRHHSWAAWQLGCLAAAMGDLDGAIAYFDRAAALASAAGDAAAADGLRRGEALARHWRDLRRQTEFHRQALAATERAEHKAAERIHELLTAPSGHLGPVLGAYGWSRTPLMFKLPAPVVQPPLPAAPEMPAYARWWQALLSWLNRRRATPAPLVREAQARPLSLPEPHFESAPVLSPLPSDPRQHTEVELEPAWAGGIEAEVAEPPVEVSAIFAAPLISSAAAPLAEEYVGQEAAGSSPPPVLDVFLLGTFQATINGRPVVHWPKGKALGIFKYLLLHHTQPALREVLMDVFWPDAEPESARNRLNVALHHLRQALRAVTDAPVVMFESGAYSLHPDLRLQLDMDEFEQHVQHGCQHEAAGRLDKAIAEYECAVALYRDDLLTEDSYESWPVLARERLRVAYLDTLDRLSQISFARGDYDASIVMCNKLLERDRCREDAHARLMRCYSLTGRTTQALRQYQTCVEALRAELDVAPAAATTELNESLRRHNHSKPNLDQRVG